MKNNKHVESFEEFNENLNISDVSNSKIIYPTSDEIKKLLDDWSNRDDSCWDYNSNRENVRETIKSCINLIRNKNK
jgi:hypothetical protein